MLPQSSSPAQPPAAPCAPAAHMPPRIGVGIDTARYGHYACFLRDDLAPAGKELAFAESAAGYAQLRQRFDASARSAQGAVHFVIRLDAAGQYADNLLHFLHTLAPSASNHPAADAARLAEQTPRGDGRGDGHADKHAAPLAGCSFAISCGDPQRNKNYRAALFGNKKSDPVEARACAHFAISLRPAHVPPMPAELRALRQAAARLQAVVRQRTRLINQFHHLLALAFPELALCVKDLATGWLLELVHRYPTAQLLAQASSADLESLPYLPHHQVEPLLTHARASVASLQDDTMVELVRDQVRQLRDIGARQKRLESLLAATYERLPQPNHLDTITGFGPVTAAVLTAFILDIDRFATPGKLVKYFGVLPIEASSGTERDGTPRGPKRYVMDRRGNDLVRRYLWMAALSALQHNPAVRALYARLVRRRPDKKSVAIGHAMRKLLHLAFAVWKTNKPFDPNHYPWGHADEEAGVETAVGSDEPPSATAPRRATQPGQATDRRRMDIPVRPAEESDTPMSQTPRAAGHNPDVPERSVVTAARRPRHDAPAGTPAPTPVADAAGSAAGSAAGAVDFAHVKQQLPLARVLDQLGLLARLKGKTAQKRGPCPIHRGDGRGRTFSVHLDDNVFQCFDAGCGCKGDVIDLWAAVQGLSQRQAALDLAATFGLEATPPTATGKRHG